jgi:hypothetical protein
MECTRWTEEGLLLSSNELAPNETESYQMHVPECEFCRDESARYEKEKSLYFNEEMLCESTSAEFDKKITEACSHFPTPATSIPLMFYVKRAAFSFMFIAVGFIGGLYVAVNYGNTEQGAIAQKQSEGAVPQQAESSVAVKTDAENVSSDSGNQNVNDFHDSIGNKVNQGNAAMKGVVPVDLN